MAIKQEISPHDVKHLDFFIRLVIIQSLLSISWILLIPGESENAVFLGYSLRRLALLLPNYIADVPRWLFFILVLQRNSFGSKTGF